MTTSGLLLVVIMVTGTAMCVGLAVESREHVNAFSSGVLAGWIALQMATCILPVSK